MRRRASRLVIGWLCGIRLMFVARSAPWPAVVHWLRSSPGLYVQSGAAMVFQLSGGALVRDVVRAEKTLAWLDYWFAELEHAIGDVDAEQQASRAAEGVESIHEPLFQAELRFRMLEGATNFLASCQSRTRDCRTVRAIPNPDLILPQCLREPLSLRGSTRGSR